MLLYVGLGSNLGEREENIRRAARLISERVGQLLKCSSIYESAPVDMKTDNMFLNAVALFMVNRDLCNVLSDHYSQLHYCSVMVPVWKYLYQRSFVGKRNKLYGYFHDGCLDVCSFKQNRFLFCNSFDITPSATGSANAHDALFFLLSVWKQLALKVDYDELHLVGDIPERDWLINELRQYLQRAYVINPASDFNRDPITRMEGLSFDLVTLWARNKRTN